MNPPPRPRRPHTPTTALFVRIPSEQADRLDRAAFVSGRAKQDLIASLLEHHVDPDAPGGLSDAPLQVPDERRPPTLEPGGSELALGHYALRPNRPAERAPEVLTVEQAAELLQVEPEVIEGMAERGELPARRLGSHWRLSRRALIDWLFAPWLASDSPERLAAGAVSASGPGPGVADR